MHACAVFAAAVEARATCIFQGIKAVGNRAYGVRVAGGVGVDLSGAVLADNAWNGLRVEHALLPGASASASVPRVILAAARVTGNGRGAGARADECDTAGLAIEATRHGASRHAAVVPPLPATPPALLGAAAAAGSAAGDDSARPVFEGNAGGAWALWRDMESSCVSSGPAQRRSGAVTRQKGAGPARGRTTDESIHAACRHVCMLCFVSHAATQCCTPAGARVTKQRAPPLSAREGPSS
jgi:hypothetical protein